MKINPELKEKLVQTAVEARKWAYVPYSRFSVGAALLTDSGKIYDGCNIENAAYSPTVCAERVAVFKAVSEGERNIVAVAVATENAVFPCGVCRQVLAEFGRDTLVLVADGQGAVKEETKLEDLLPKAFRSDQLEEGQQ